jgi:hypothetical protein
MDWFFRIWIALVADTKMKKTTPGMKFFRRTFIFARRKEHLAGLPYYLPQAAGFNRAAGCNRAASVSKAAPRRV